MHSTMKRLCLGWTGLVVAAAALAADRPQPMIGEPAPVFSLETLGGNRVALADFREKYVVLHFGAGW